MKQTTKNKKTPTEKKKLYTEIPSIFAVDYKEIARRQFFAGFMSGLGAAVATLLVGFIVTVIIARYIAPRTYDILGGIKTTLESAGFNL